MLSAAVMVIFFGCGGENAPADDQQGQQSGEDYPTSLEMPDIDQWLVIQDSIGVELGDSNLVFGAVAAVRSLPNGNIAIADIAKTVIKVYTPQGEYIASVGQQGQGPGEYLMLSGFDVTPDGGFIVPDAMGGKINFYDSDFNFTHSMDGFFPAPPVMISAVDGGFVGMKPAFEQTEDEMRTGMGVSLWTSSAEADYVYVENLIPFDMNDMGAMAKTAVMFATDSQDNVFLAQYDTEHYVINAVTREGEALWTIEEEYPMVRKSAEDIEIEREIVRSRMTAGGAPPAMAESYEPDIYRSMIGMLFVDNNDRLWVLGGLYDGAVFRVYDSQSGEFLFTAALRADESKKQVVPYITRYGIVAFAADSDEWPRVYLVAPEDPSLFELPEGSETTVQL